MQLYYDGFDKVGWDGGNYMAGEDHWGLVAKRRPAADGKPALWRVTYGETVGLSTEEYLQRREKKFREMLPGRPEPNEYSVDQTDRFKSHNRCVDSMKVDRIMLAADAAHVCTPYGGYGCMSAIVDIGGLVECLVGINEDKLDEDVLDKWAEIRREKFMRFVGPRSIKNMARLSKPDILKDDKFMKLLGELNEDQAEMRSFLLVSAER